MSWRSTRLRADKGFGFFIIILVMIAARKSMAFTLKCDPKAPN